MDRTHGEKILAEDPWTFGGYEVHPLARYTPRLDERRMEALKRQIGQCGPPPVLKHGEMILGDHNICRACRELGIEVAYVEWDGSGSLGEAVAHATVDRRQHDASVRAGMAAPVREQLRSEIQPRRNANLRRGSEAAGTLKTAFSAKFPEFAQCANSGNTDHKPNIHGEHSARLAADLYQVSESAVNQATHLWKKHPDLYAQLLSGSLNLSQARLKSDKRKRNKQSAAAAEDRKRRGIVPDGKWDQPVVGECVSVMKGWVDGPGFDLIFADPPYNLHIPYDSDPTADLMSDSGYLAFSEAWIKHCARLLKPAGSMYVMIDDNWQDRLCVLMRGAGLHHRRTLVWYSNFGNNTERNFVTAARFIHYFTKHKTNFAWNMDEVRVPSHRDRIGDERRPHDRGKMPDNVIRWDPGEANVWDDVKMVPGNAEARVPFDDAPPQVPALILERLIRLSSHPGDRVFDPFMGNGTTWRASRKLARAFTGIERSPLYAKQAERWAMAQARP